MTSFTDDQYNLLLEKNALLTKQLCIAQEALEISRSNYLNNFVIWKTAEALIGEYKKAFSQMKFSDIQSAPLNGTEIMCLTAKGLLKKAKWLVGAAIPAWGDTYNLTTNWTFPDNDPPVSWLPLVPTGIWQPMASAPVDGTEIIISIPGVNKYKIVSWCRNMNGEYGFWSRFELYASFLQRDSINDYVWLAVPTVLTE